MRIITGMHRSGTSLVARLFLEAGEDLGDPATFYPGDKWNPDGYFEQIPVLDLNRPLLHGPFGRLAYLHLPGEATILKRSDRMADRIAAAARENRDRVVKDTRFCITLPAWLRHGAEVRGILACLRDPGSVARSLSRRNRIPLRLGYSLWVEHNERLLRAARGIPLRILAYDALLDPERFAGEMGPAFRFFGVALPPRRLEAVGRLCVKPSMDHGVRAHGRLPRATAEMWDRLREMRARQEAAPGAAGGAGG